MTTCETPGPRPSTGDHGRPHGPVPACSAATARGAARRPPVTAPMNSRRSTTRSPHPPAPAATKLGASCPMPRIFWTCGDVGTCDGSLLDHLIRPREHRLRNSQAKRLGGLEVDHQLELGGLLDGQVGGLGTLEDLVHVGSGAPI